MLGWEALGVSSALGDKATQCVVPTSWLHAFSPPCCEACAVLSDELGLPEEQGRMAGTLKDASRRSCLPAPGYAQVMGLDGRGRRLPLLHAIVSSLSTRLLAVVMCWLQWNGHPRAVALGGRREV